MIQVFSNYIKVKEEQYYNFLWFIEDVVGLKVLEKDGFVAFAGIYEGYLSQFAVDLSSATDLFGLTEDQYEIYEEDIILEDDEPLVLVWFDVVLSKLIEVSIQYIEIDLEQMTGITSELFSNGDCNSSKIDLNFGNEEIVA